MARYKEAKSITPETRKAVLERQGGTSISGRYLTEGTASFHHYVERSSGGVGYEWNIVALTFEEHRAVHDKRPILVDPYRSKQILYEHKRFVEKMREHLMENYINWSEDNCKYKKRLLEQDYGIVRRTRL